MLRSLINLIYLSAFLLNLSQATPVSLQGKPTLEAFDAVRSPETKPSLSLDQLKPADWHEGDLTHLGSERDGRSSLPNHLRYKRSTGGWGSFTKILGGSGNKSKSASAKEEAAAAARAERAREQEEAKAAVDAAVASGQRDKTIWLPSNSSQK
ncbi:hypothetical protein O181_055294 [Austropuccinia psidii MF-1]|uniref:Uncharacterized protein n=1 Tax=Austropuccinia psidii MF-1 TaxID=1389203 RepID=A0A9Q3E668_9BASI|nr:hypothetical protein [Austropuccinia psidii MF-1]